MQDTNTVQRSTRWRACGEDACAHVLMGRDSQSHRVLAMGVRVVSRLVTVTNCR
jgi:hypothetical protein